MFTMRQSNLATFSRCPLSARFELEAGERYSPELIRGTICHRVAAEIMRTLRRTGESAIPVQEALNIAYEQMAQVDVPSKDVIVLSAEEKLNVIQFVVRFATDWEFDGARILAVEERLTHTIKCEDGVERVLTGSPDAIIADPPDALIVPDYKSGWGPPKTPRSDEPAEPRRYLTERGHYQLDTYGLLALVRYPKAERVTLHEVHPRASESRDAVLERDDMQEVERLIGIDLMLMDRATSEGRDSKVWKAVGGTSQCGWCIGRHECPKASQRLDVKPILDLGMAVDYAERVEAVTPYRAKDLIPACKAWVEANGPIPLPDGRVLGWRNLAEKGRRFEAHTPEPELDVADALEQSLQEVG